MARDWSAEGAAEREQSYGRITAELTRLFVGWPAALEPPAVLVPGAGLGRLCLEITNLVRPEGCGCHCCLAPPQVLMTLPRLLKNAATAGLPGPGE